MGLSIVGFKNVKKITEDYFDMKEFSFHITQLEKDEYLFMLPTAEVGYYLGEWIEFEKIWSFGYRTYNQFREKLVELIPSWVFLLHFTNCDGDIEPSMVKKMSASLNYHHERIKQINDTDFIELFEIFKNIFNKTAELDGWIVYQ